VAGGNPIDYTGIAAILESLWALVH
jgi:hypothetical protein